jgi:hypothetical protein
VERDRPGGLFEELSSSLSALPSFRPVRWRWLWEHPECVFLPLVILLFLVNDAPFGFGPGYSIKFVAYLGDPGQGGIFPVTWAASWCTFVIAAVAGRRWTNLGTVRSMLVAASLPFGATGVFEIVYQLVGDWVQPGGFHMSHFSWISIVLWAAVGATSFVYWRVSWEFGLVVVLLVGGFLAWAAEGYSQITWGSITAEPWAYGFNIALKVGAFVLFLLPTLRGWQTTPVPARPALASPDP